ncbi:MAG: hypothetical protein AAB546_04160 [Patescibacteria group bacterium]
MARDRINELIIPKRIGEIDFVPVGSNHDTEGEANGGLKWLHNFIDSRASLLRGIDPQFPELPGIPAYEIFKKLQEDRLCKNPYLVVFTNKSFPDRKESPSTFPASGLLLNPTGGVDGLALTQQILSQTNPQAKEKDQDSVEFGIVAQLNIKDYWIDDRKTFLMISTNGKRLNVKILNSSSVRIYNEWRKKSKTVDVSREHPSRVIVYIPQLLRRTIVKDNDNKINEVERSIATLGIGNNHLVSLANQKLLR